MRHLLCLNSIRPVFLGSYANLITALEPLFTLSYTVRGRNSLTTGRKYLRPQAMCLFVYVCVLAGLINIADVDVSKSGLFGTARNSSGAAALALTAWEAITWASVLSKQYATSSHVIHDTSSETCKVTTCQELPASHSSLSPDSIW